MVQIRRAMRFGALSSLAVAATAREGQGKAGFPVPVGLAETFL